MKNSETIGKYVIVKDLSFSDYMKNDKGEITTYDSLDDACNVCGMYEFEDVIVMKVEYNHIEKN
jgi:hypothetical protein